MSAIFDQCFAVVIGNEGGFTDNQADPGNWTGGRVGAGKLLGTNWGISGASYPKVDIAALTLDDAKLIYARDYWTPASCAGLAGPLALLVFDAAVNNGVARARAWLVLAEAAGPTGAEKCAEFMAQRMNFMGGLAAWRTFGLGWSRRLARLPFAAIQITGA